MHHHPTTWQITGRRTSVQPSKDEFDPADQQDSSGAAFGAVLDNIEVGVAFGVRIGVAIGLVTGGVVDL